MPPKSRSSTSKAASSSKASPSLGFGSSKKGVEAAAGGKKGAAVKKEESPAVEAAPPRPKSSIAGLYPKLYNASLKRMGKPIHRDELDDIEIILRVFDATEDYGPCSRISRLERFERAERLGLNPNPQIGEILRSEDGKNRPEYADSVFQI
ncbi:hypothetical protein JCM8097_005659 [Rhodosporidiobolus ruineniae]